MPVTIKPADDLLGCPAQVIVNAVNCRGVMGKGVAALFRGRSDYRGMVADYEKRCGAGEVRLGEPYLWRPSGRAASESSQMALFASADDEAPAEAKWVLNFPTKDHWRDSSRLLDIDRGLAHAAERRRGWGIASMAVPALGCGNGRLCWPIVGSVLAGWLEDRFPDVDVQLLPPPGRGEAPSEIRPAWVDIAAAMSASGKALGTGGDHRISVEAFAGALAGACGDLLGPRGASSAFFTTVLQRLSDNGIVSYGLDLATRRGQAHSPYALLAEGPAFQSAAAWRPSQSEPRPQAVCQAADRLSESIHRFAGR